MRDEIRMILGQSQYFGLAVSVAAYLFAAWLRKKTKLAILNPLLISSALIIGCLVCVGMDYETYNKGAGFLGWLLTPATVCLAIPLYRQLNLLRQHGAAVLISILAGVATSAVSVFLLSKALGLGHVHYGTLLPKSITTAIGVLGNMACELILRLARVSHPVAKGLALGTSAHAVGTAKALEMGEIEGAMSSLSIAVAGLLTVVAVPLVANLI